MRHFSNIAQKEIREMLTLSALIPMVIMALLFASLGGAIGGVREEVSKPPIIGFINNDGSDLSLIAAIVLEKNAQIIYNGSNVSEGLAILNENNGVALISIDQNITQDILSNESGTMRVYWIMRGTGQLDSVPSSAVDSLLGTVDKTISAALINSHASSNSTVILNPTIRNETTLVKGMQMSGASPGLISGMVASQSFVIPLIVMMVMNNLMFHDYALVFAGIAYEAVFAALTMAASVWVLKQDLLLTGRVRKGNKKRISSGDLMPRKR